MRGICVYVASLHDKIFKILPMKETGDSTLPTYLCNLCIEIKGAAATYPVLADMREYVDFVNIAHYLSNNDVETPVIRTQMFRMQSLISAIERKVGELDGN